MIDGNKQTSIPIVNFSHRFLKFKSWRLIRFRDSSATEPSVTTTRGSTSSTVRRRKSAQFSSSLLLGLRFVPDGFRGLQSAALVMKIWARVRPIEAMKRSKVLSGLITAKRNPRAVGSFSPGCFTDEQYPRIYLPVGPAEHRCSSHTSPGNECRLQPR